MKETEFQAWKAQPQTKMFFRYLRERYEQSKEDWAMENFIGDSLEAMAMQNAKALGGISVLRDLIEITHEDMSDE